MKRFIGKGIGSMGIIRSVIVQWVVMNGGKVDRRDDSVYYFIPVSRIDAFFSYLRECLAFKESNMFSCKLQDGYMIVPRYSIEQNIVF